MMNTFTTRTTNPKPTVAQPEVVGKKNDLGKLRFDLVDADFEEQLAKVITYGANKYAPDNWKKVEDPVNRYYAALRRHLAAWRKGEKVDPESGLNHLAHVAANVMFLMHFECPGDKE